MQDNRLVSPIWSSGRCRLFVLATTVAVEHPGSCEVARVASSCRDRRNGCAEMDGLLWPATLPPLCLKNENRDVLHVGDELIRLDRTRWRISLQKCHRGIKVIHPPFSELK